MSEKPALHVVFGTGPLAMSVMRALLTEGKNVRMVNRSGRGKVPLGVELCRGDLTSAADAAALTEGVAVAYQCAQPPYHRWPEEFPPLQAAIIEGVARSGAKLVIGENLYMYGEVRGPIHERLPYSAHTRKGRVRARMAEASLQAHRQGKLRVTIARGSDFFGPGVLESALGARAILPALAGKAAQLGGNLDLPHTYTFIDDFGKAMVLLGSRDEALGEAWHVPNDRPEITQRELMTLFFEEMGLPPRMKGVSKGMMRIAGLFIPGARETVEMMYEFENPFVVESGKFERAFGMKATPIRDAVARTVAWYREHRPELLK